MAIQHSDNFVLRNCFGYINSCHTHKYIFMCDKMLYTPVIYPNEHACVGWAGSLDYTHYPSKTLCEHFSACEISPQITH